MGQQTLGVVETLATHLRLDHVGEITVKRPFLPFLGIGLLLLAIPMQAQPKAAGYKSMKTWLFDATPRSVPAEGIRWQRETATLELSRGRIWLMQPVTGGHITGLVFEGEGRFVLEIPEAVELEQIRRMTRRPEAERLEVSFSELVLRTSEPWLDELAESLEATGGLFARQELAEKRLERWLTRYFFDADARIVCGLNMDGDRFFRAEMLDKKLGWMLYEFDGLRREAVSLGRIDPIHDHPESWVRLESSDSTGQWDQASLGVDVVHFDIRADITKGGKKYGKVGISQTPTSDVQLLVTMTYLPETSGPLVLPMSLSPRAIVESVKDEEGRELSFLRDHIGGRSALIDNDIYDNSLLVLLDRPLVAGEERRLTFEYELPIFNYAGGRSWYPDAGGGVWDLHTGRLEVVGRKGYEIRSMGERLSESVEGKTKTAIWNVTEPTRMLTFAFADGIIEQSIEQEDLPEVVCFAPKAGVASKNKVWNVCADVSNAMAYFGQYFDHPLPDKRHYVTAIVANHGQSFEGFIHMGEGSFDSDHPGATQLFRSHEVAHQWWGHIVAWETYRDQWLSESFAEYSAMLFVEATEKKGSDYLSEILDTYHAALTGSIKGSFSKFSRNWMSELNDRHRQEIGPIAVGTRASTANAPYGYSLQHYVRGPMVLHMLRVMLRNLSGNDDLFRRVLSEFVRRHAGGSANTDDFVAAMTAVAPGDWQWFFDQWIDTPVIPTYRWRYEISKGKGGTGHALSLTVEQSDVPKGFRMPVPVRLDFGGKKTGQVVILVDQPKETFTIPIPKKPKKVVFNPDHSVLAVTKKQ